jgi:hypothetical protein
MNNVTTAICQVRRRAMDHISQHAAPVEIVTWDASQSVVDQVWDRVSQPVWQLVLQQVSIDPISRIAVMRRYWLQMREQVKQQW